MYYTYIPITLLNDFVFCPRSIYFHYLYEKYSEVNYKRTPQKVGSLKHENIEQKRYSTSKSVLQGMSVFCDKYNIGGKIDVFDMESGELVERKYKIRKIYDGYRYQLYAQYFCLKEMGYSVRKMFLHSLSDNKRYAVSIPSKEDVEEFEQLLDRIRSFDLHSDNFVINKEKCKNCIYSELCDLYSN